MATIQSIVDRIHSGHANRILVLTGAGISTAAGIPDFRTPQTGLYDRLTPLRLPYPEAIFHISYFQHTPEPFYAIARARHPRNLTPTLSHAFLALLARKNLLHFVVTQNIDELEVDAGVPVERVLAAHGSWKTQRCWRCKMSYPDADMKRAIETGEVPYCLEEGCGGAVKPDVVFFGEALPPAFHHVVEQEKVPEADLMIIMGSSLKVAPCSKLPRLVGEDVPRVLINLEKAGDVGSRASDVCILGSCDEGVRRLANELGWREELEEVWGDAVARKKELGIDIDIDWRGDDGPDLDEAIQRLAGKMKGSTTSEGHKRMLEQHLEAKFAHLSPK